jgi:hypothetical protein
MIDLTPQITQAQIAAFLGIIAVVLVYIAFVKKPNKKKHN